MKRALDRLMIRTLLALAILAGICASAIGIANADAKAEQDKPAQEMSAADTAKWSGFFDKLVAAVVKASSATCEQLAADVNKVIEANHDAIAIARAAHAAGRRLPQSAQQRMLDGVKKMVPALKRCGQDDKVRAAFARLDLTRRDTAAARR